MRTALRGNAFLLFMLVCSALCATDVTVKGKVSDSDGKPLRAFIGVVFAPNSGPPDAWVPTEKVIRTRKNGSFTLTIRADKPFYLFAYAEGYRPQLWKNISYFGVVPTGALLKQAQPIDPQSPPKVVLTFTLSRAFAEKRTVMLKMSDGVELATDIYLPTAKGPFPTLLMRTPYSRKRKGFVRAAKGLCAFGYAVVLQDMRGRFDSGGENLPFCGCGWHKHKDGYETVRWLLKQSWCNGKVGTFGGSAMGITQFLLAGSGVSGLAAQWIGAAAFSLYHHATYENGVLRLEQVKGWLTKARFAPNFYKNVLAHPDYDDFWRPYDPSTRQYTPPPAVHITGWFDTFCEGTIAGFLARSEGNPTRARQFLIVGPWTHKIRTVPLWLRLMGREPKTGGRVGEMELTPQAVLPPLDMTAFFAWQLQGADNGFARQKPVHWFVLAPRGSAGNFWRAANSWPPPSKPLNLYLQPDKTLAFKPCSQQKTFTYRYDPNNPCPTLGGRNLTIKSGPFDQKRLAKRDDVLVFASPPLEQSVEIAGVVECVLCVSSDCSDTDFVAKLCDGYPDGRQMLLLDGIVRLSRRQWPKQPLPVVPNKIYTVRIRLGNFAYLFPKGHRIVVHITSSNYPRYETNPNTGEVHSREKSRVAKNSVYVGKNHPSRLILPHLASEPQNK